MFWIELYLILQMASWFVFRLELNLSIGERNALSVLLALGLKSILLFAYIILGLKRFFDFSLILTGLVFVLYFIWVKGRPLAYLESSTKKTAASGLHKYSGFWVLFLLFILSLANAWIFPITGADGIWHHVKGMVYGQSLASFDSEQIISQFRQYPPLVGLLYGWLIDAGFERITIIFPILYLCLLWIVFYRVSEHTRDSKIAGMVSLLVGTTPYLWWHSFLPFLDWVAGVFYAVGVLYWFSLIKSISKLTKNTNATQNRSLSLLSGLFFGLSSWTRPEFVLYSALPLFLLVCAFDRDKEFVGWKNMVIARFAIAMLTLPSLWFSVIYNFSGPLDSTFKQLIIGCAGLWIGLGLVLFGWVRFTPRTSAMTIIVSVIICFSGLFFILPPDISPWTAFAVRFFRLFAVHIFFMGTVLLIFFLFTERLQQLSLAEKDLGVLLLLFLLAQFFIYAYSGLKWPTLSQHVYNTFVYPGNSVNSSDTRGTLGIYPAFIFFIFCLLKAKTGVEFCRTRRFLLGIIVVNLAVILIVFAVPRIKFITDNFDKSYEQLAETSGPPDLPNQFVKTYQVAHQLRKRVKKEWSLVLPPGTKEGSIRSVITQVLFGQKITFADDPYFTRELEKQSFPYGVSPLEGKDAVCNGIEGEVLGDTGFVLCRLD